jgi:hypothetical protein
LVIGIASLFNGKDECVGDWDSRSCRQSFLGVGAASVARITGNPGIVGAVLGSGSLGLSAESGFVVSLADGWLDPFIAGRFVGSAQWFLAPAEGISLGGAVWVVGHGEPPQIV